MKFKWLKRFKSDESGTATIESVLWLPLFFYLLLLVVDVSFIFFGKAQILQDSHDGNRALSTGSLGNAAEAQSFITNAISDFSANATVTTVIDNGTSIVTTTINVPATDLMAIGYVPVFNSTNIQIVAQHMLEH